MDFADGLNGSLRAEGIEIRGPVTEAYKEILTPEALRFLARLARRFEATRQERLAARVKKQAEIDSGVLPDFPAETPRSAPRPGPSRPSRATWRTAASKSPARSSARW